MSRRSWLALLFLAALWGASYMLIKISLDDLSPAVVVFARTALAALVLVPLAARGGGFSGLSDALGLVVVAAAVQVAGPFFLITAGEQEISSSLAGVLVASTPLFTALLAIWLDHAERSTGPRALGLVAGFVGVALLIGVDLGKSPGSLLAGVGVTLAGLGYAIGGFIIKRSSASADPIAIAAATMLVSTALMAPLALATAPAAPPGLATVGAILALGLLGTGLAFAIFYPLTAKVGPARAWLVSYIAPAFAILYGVTLLGESLTAATLVGLALIMGGSWVSAGQSVPGARWRAAPSSPRPRYGRPRLRRRGEAAP